MMGTTRLEEFWPLYLRAHRNRYTRGAHYVGIGCGVLLAILGAATLNPWLLLVATGSALAVTVASHWVFEGRRPLLLINPLFGALCDLRMFFLAITGRLEAELSRYGIVTESVVARSPMRRGRIHGGETEPISWRRDASGRASDSFRREDSLGPRNGRWESRC